MANQTVTTVVNYDDAAISGLANGETLTINGGSVTINADTRWNQQAAVFGAVTLSSTLGGSFILDGTEVWEIPFSASSGNVPTQAALGSNGITGVTSSSTGELTRVWATGSVTPEAAGRTMPATGFIKLRSKVGSFDAGGEVINLPGGATITSTGAGKRSWIHVVGRGTTTGTGSRLTIPRLGTFEATGDWYDLGATNGADDQTFQYPVADMCPAIWIETSSGSGVYEVWLNAGARWSDNSVATADVRGKYFGMVAATGVITIASRTGNTAGLKPPTGCNVRIPNIIMSSANGTAPDWDSNILPASASSRYSFTTTSAGSVIMDKVSCNWLMATSAAFEIDITNSGIGGPSISFANTGTTVNLNNVGIGVVDTIAANVLTISTSYGGGTLTDVFASRRLAASNGRGIYLQDTADFTLTRCRSDAFGASGTNNPTSSQSCFEVVRAIITTLVDCIGVGGIGIDAQPAFGLTSTNFQYASRTIGTTGTTDTASVVSYGTGSTDLYVDGFSNFGDIANVHSYGSSILISGGANNCEIRNIGTSAAPYNMGSANTGQYLINVGTSRNIILRRLYCQNTRTTPLLSANTVQGLQAYNVWGDTADTVAIAAINATVRGGRWTQSTSGQTAVYGTHWSDTFTSTTAGTLSILGNETTVDTADQCVFTLDTSNGSGFTSAGGISLTQLSDTVEWTMPYYMLGHTGFSASAPTITGTGTANFTLDFKYDLNDGLGFTGSWETLNGTNLSAITIDPALGIKLKVRLTVNNAVSTNLFTILRITTVTNSTDQQIQYPLPTNRQGSITNIRAGSRLQVYNQTTSTEIINTVVAGTSYTYDYNNGSGITDGNTLRIRLSLCGGATASKDFQSLAEANSLGFSLLASQEDDTVYNGLGIDGSAVTEFSADYPNIEVDINDPDGTTTIARLYAWWANERTTEEGIRTLAGGLIAEDAGNFKVISSIIDLKLDNTSATGVVFTGDIRLYRDDGQSPVVGSTSGGGSITLYAGKVYVVSTGGSALTPTENAKLMGLPTNALTTPNFLALK